MGGHSPQGDEPAAKRAKREIKLLEDIGEEDESEDNEDSENGSVIRSFLLTSSEVFLKRLANEPIEIKKLHETLFRKYLKSMELKSMKKGRDCFYQLCKHQRFLEALLSFMWHKAKSI